ncbi:hypothetical protein R1sor_024418 [Riccia sorocarpa]|uniref:C2 domain-containing protein n=1 Tax=Riccia sorocarpa TaxID=122646 RepID=A0ABD3GSP7_9MARC
MGRNKYKLFASTIADPSYTIISDDLVLQDEDTYRHKTVTEDPEEVDMTIDQDTYGKKKEENELEDQIHDEEAYHGSDGSIAKEEQQQQQQGEELHRHNKELKELELEEKDPYRDVIRELKEKQLLGRDKLSSHDPRNKTPREESKYKYRDDVDLQDAYRNPKEGRAGRHDEDLCMYCSPGPQRTRYTSPLIPQPALPADCSRGVMQMEVHMASGIKGSYMLGQVKASPYIVLKYSHDKRELRSSVDRGGGSCPSWNETFFYNVMNPAHRPPLLHIEIWSQLMARKDKLIGRVSIDNILEYVCKNPLMCTPHMWLPIFYHRKKDYDVRERGKLLVRFWFETKDPTYFGDARWREDHTYSKNKEKKSVDITAAGIEPKYTILTNILVLQYTGTVIRLDVNDLE